MQDKGPSPSLKAATQMSGTAPLKISDHLHFPVSNSLYIHTADVCILYVSLFFTLLCLLC